MPDRRLPSFLSAVLLVLYPGFPAGRAGIALAALRAFTGTALCIHGYGKWVDVASFAAEFGIPYSLAWFAAFTQMTAGIAVVAGIAFPLAAASLAGTMIVATAELIARGEAWINPHGHSFESASLYALLTILLLLLGPGAYSLDQILLSRRIAANAPTFFGASR